MRFAHFWQLTLPEASAAGASTRGWRKPDTFIDNNRRIDREEDFDT
jgi:hypothetical protein